VDLTSRKPGSLDDCRVATRPSSPGVLTTGVRVRARRLDHDEDRRLRRAWTVSLSASHQTLPSRRRRPQLGFVLKCSCGRGVGADSGGRVRGPRPTKAPALWARSSSRRPATAVSVPISARRAETRSTTKALATIPRAVRLRIHMTTVSGHQCGLAARQCHSTRSRQLPVRTTPRHTRVTTSLRAASARPAADSGVAWTPLERRPPPHLFQACSPDLARHNDFLQITCVTRIHRPRPPWPMTDLSEASSPSGHRVILTVVVTSSTSPLQLSRQRLAR
jgi:hypothetical protein